MNLTLNRFLYHPWGVFGRLLDDQNQQMAVTLEHAYDDGADGWIPKIPASRTFICKRGLHRLHGMEHDFETFEITGVEGHSNLLFHWGNFNSASEGCVLVGEKIEIGDDPKTQGPDEMVTNSRATFAKFMALQDGLDEFDLVVNG